MIRTALYVYEPSTVTITASDPSEVGIQICRYNQKPSGSPVGTSKLEPGIYLILSKAPVAVDLRSLDVVAIRGDKDEWPDPKATVIALEPGATAASIKGFFQIAKSIDV